MQTMPEAVSEVRRSVEADIRQTMVTRPDLSLQDIATIYGVSLWVLRRIRKEHNLEPRTRGRRKQQGR